MAPVILVLGLVMWLALAGTASAAPPADPGAQGAERASAAQSSQDAPAASENARDQKAEPKAEKPAAQKAEPKNDKPAAQKAEPKADKPAPAAAAKQDKNTDSGPKEDRFGDRFGDPTKPQPLSNADKNDGGANGQCPEGPYCSTRDGSPSENGKSDNNNSKKPCAGCVGRADNKNPKGQFPNGSDKNAGYECDRNQGIGQGNPAHTGCQAPVEEPDCVPSEANDFCGEGEGECVPSPANDFCGEGEGECVPSPANDFCGEGEGDCVPSPANDFCGEGEGDCVPTPANDFCGEVIDGGGVLPPPDVIDRDGDDIPNQVAGPASGGAVSSPTVAPQDAGTDTLPNTGVTGGLEVVLLFGLSMLGAGALLLRRRVMIG